MAVKLLEWNLQVMENASNGLCMHEFVQFDRLTQRFVTPDSVKTPIILSTKLSARELVETVLCSDTVNNITLDLNCLMTD